MARGEVFCNGKHLLEQAKIGERLLTFLERVGVLPEAPCGGNGTCGKCRVLASGALSPLSKAELWMLGEDAEKGIRLACMCKVEGDFCVRLSIGAIRVETDFAQTRAPIPPGEHYDGLGLAIDLGTTTIAAYLLDGMSGERLASRGFRNPQCAYGADVISRCDKIMKNKGALSEMQALVMGAISEVAAELAASVGHSSAEIKRAVLCGNTIMEHIAAGMDPSPLAVAPFVAKTLFGYALSAEALGLALAPGAMVYFAPCVASYVGGDIVCGAIACDLGGVRENVLFLDVGTNGEIGLSVGGILFFCSTAAGPAFEGAHIACGMAGTSGAICEVTSENGVLGYQTIDDVPPVGICGSGILDAVAVLLHDGILDETGCLDDACADVEKGEDGELRFYLDRKHEVFLCGHDIREVQLAKAAIAAGVKTLLHHAGISLAEVNRVILAGGFGSHLRAKSACRVGLLPAGVEEKVAFAGNTAGAGAQMLLQNENLREAAERICLDAAYVELSASAFFMNAYLEEMGFEE